MNRKIKIILLSVLMSLCLVFVGACGETLKVVSVEKTATSGLVDTYTITYSDGSKFDFTVTNGENGEDAQSVTLSQAYAEAVANGYSGSYLDFIIECNTQDNAAAVSAAMKSAVSVYSEHPVTKTEYYYTPGPFGGWSVSSREVKDLSLSAGSGIIYKTDDSSVYIVTNYHVVYYNDSDTDNKIGRKLVVYTYGNSDSPSAVLDDSGNVATGEDGYPCYEYGSGIQCEYVGGSMVYDIAVLKADAAQFGNIEIAPVVTAEQVNVGDYVFAIGNPNGSGISVTGGMVSVDSEYITMTAADDVTSVVYRALRTDTAINSGNSGGGLFNEKGQLVGLVNAKLTSPTIENIAYAVPLSIVRGAADNIIDGQPSGSQAIEKLNLGVTVASSDSRAEYDALTGKVSVSERVTVSDVQSGSMGEELGLQQGDIIMRVEIDGTATEIKRAYNVGDAMFAARKGNAIVITVARNGETQKLQGVCDASYFTKID